MNSTDQASPNTDDTRTVEEVEEHIRRANATPYYWMPEARQIAAQCWCDDETKHIEMDVVLAEAVAKRIAAWMRTGAQHAGNEEYWRNRAVAAEAAISKHEADKAAGVGGEAVARLLYWHGPSHMNVPFDGVCARTFTEFPRNEADKPDSYWKNGPSLFASLPSPQAAQAEDTARLDWLDSMNEALNRRNGTTYRWKLILSPMVVRLMAGQHVDGRVGDIDLHDSEARGAASCRQAIDEARGIAPAPRNVLREAIDRLHHIMQKHGLHPGRTDDDLLEILDSHLTAAPSPDGKAEQRPQNCGTGYCSCIECPFEATEAEQAEAPSEPDYDALEREHMGDFEKKTGIYATQPRASGAERLTDEFIDDAANRHFGVSQAENFHRNDTRRRNFAREIERAALAAAPTKEPEQAEAPSTDWPLEADPLTQLIQRLNSNAYNLTKDECIEEAKRLRAELATQPPAGERDCPYWTDGPQRSAWIDGYRAALAAKQPEQKPVAWCELTAAGSIAHFDGKPMVMCGPVGNEHHPHALYTTPQPEQVAQDKGSRHAS